MVKLSSLILIFCLSIVGLYTLTHHAVPTTPITGSGASISIDTASGIPSPPTESSWVCISNPDIRVFMYHYIRDDDPRDSPVERNLSVTPSTFDEHMRTVAELEKDWQIQTMWGEDLIHAIDTHCFPWKRIWVFTSDDGWVDSADSLAPIAIRHHIPFIFWIISWKVGKTGFVSREQLRSIASNPLFTIASHTITHRELTSLDESSDRREICESRSDLWDLIGNEVKIFIYPVGKIGTTSVKHLRECGYKIAWSTSFGKDLNWKNPDFYTMNRTRISHDTSAEFYKKLAK